MKKKPDLNIWIGKAVRIQTNLYTPSTEESTEGVLSFVGCFIYADDKDVYINTDFEEDAVNLTITRSSCIIIEEVELDESEGLIN